MTSSHFRVDEARRLIIDDVFGDDYAIGCSGEVDEGKFLILGWQKGTF